MQLEKVYEPQRLEPRWAAWWIESGIYQAPRRPERPVFSLVIPPPNVTGSLHIGHMLEHSEIDVTIRYQRMRGKDTLWLPGTDHAGIATQMVVERALAEKGLSRHDLGREEFEKRVWEWKEQYGGTIKRQMIRTGVSCDWSRERFTLDPGLNRAVREVFVRLYRKGLIYRGEYMISWCPRCHTALSDLEVVHDETSGNLWHIRYPVKDSGTYLTVATTRPETMLGDTAVCVHPADERYRDLHGRTVILPLMNREIPVIPDELADPQFGTGVVKVTPAHDPNDFEAGKRHNLPKITVIGFDARMTLEAGEFAGLDRFEARKRVVARLDELGLLEKVQPYTLSLGKCQRCKTPIEPLISTQWFARMKPLAEPAIRAVEEGRIRFIPENWKKTYYEWMRNIRDWCVSRQLWWGHRIPAWHCTCGAVTVDVEAPSRCSACGGTQIAQDPDVLDTWFSSALWPFSTLGWPDQTDDLKYYYPTSLLITGFDILFFWVARMIMMGLECMDDVPFREVYIHGLVRDAERQKMSKTRGNTIDPLVVTEKYGTDAVRFALLRGAAPGTDIILSEDRMEVARNFANKIWNAARFIALNMERAGVSGHDYSPEEAMRPEPVGSETPLEDRWMFSRLNSVAESLNRAIEQYRYHEAAETLYHYFWHEFCDWYVELKKLRLQEPGGAEHLKNLLRVFEASLRLLHPLMPFLTEELWQRFVKDSAARPTSISLAPYPQAVQSAVDQEAVRQVELVQEIITTARALRADQKLDPKTALEGLLHVPGDGEAVVRAMYPAIQALTNVRFKLTNEAPPVSASARSTPHFTLSLQLPEAQATALRERLEKEVQQLEKLVANSERQLRNQDFLERAPAHVVAGIREKLAGYRAQLEKSRQNLAALA